MAGALVFVAAADVGLLEGGVLPTRVSTRSAISRSVNRVVTVARIAKMKLPVLIGRGRDAADVALSTSYGLTTLIGFKVVTDEIVA